MQDGNTYQVCPIFRNIPSVSYIANVTGNDARLATIPSNNDLASFLSIVHNIFANVLHFGVFLRSTKKVILIFLFLEA